jgi:hypothetical protein
MPSPLHNTLARGIGHEISIQLGVFRNSPKPKTAKLGRSISPTDDVDIEFHVAAKRFDQRNPEKTYTFTSCNFPGLVIEVAWSQRQLDLAGLAEEYIQRSKGLNPNCRGCKCRIPGGGTCHVLSMAHAG